MGGSKLFEGHVRGQSSVVHHSSLVVVGRYLSLTRGRRARWSSTPTRVPVLQMVDQLFSFFFDTFRPVVAEHVFEVPKTMLKEPNIPQRTGSWWKCQSLFSVEQTVDITVPGVFLVYAQDRVQQLVTLEVFKVYSQDRVPQRSWTLRRSIFKCFFRTFPWSIKSARVAAHSNAELTTWIRRTLNQWQPPWER